MTTALEGGEGSASRPGRYLPLGKTLYPLYRRLGGPQGRSGQVRKISPPTRFDPRTVQPVASRYTDSTTRPTPNVKRVMRYRSMRWTGQVASMEREDTYTGPWEKQKKEITSKT